MARFELESGEAILERVPCTTPEDGETFEGELILTTRRVVLLRSKVRAPMMPLAQGTLMPFTPDRGLLDMLTRLFSKKRMTHQIRREDLASVEPCDRGLRIRSDGEGYAMTWFDVRTHSDDAWLRRLREWRGMPAAAPSISP